MIAELAHHHHRALAVGDPERAYARARAALSRRPRSRYEQAAQHYEQAVAALAHVRPVAPERALGVLLELGEACRLSGERTRRREVLTEAMELARSLGRRDDFARAAIGFSRPAGLGRPRRRRARGGRARRSRVGPEPGVRARACSRGSRASTFRARRDRAADRARGRRLARAHGDPEALQDALYALHFALGGPDHLEERERLARRSSRVAPDSRSRDRALVALLDVGERPLMRGDAAGARALRARGRVAGERRSRHALALAVYDTGIALLEGRFDDAAALARDAARARPAHRASVRARCTRGQRAMLARERGDPARSLRAPRAVAGAREGSAHWVQAWSRAPSSRRARGRGARALRVARARRFDDVPRNLRWTATMVELAHLCADLGDALRARAAARAAAPVEHRTACCPWRSSTADRRAALARLAETLGESDDASALYDEALDRERGSARDRCGRASPLPRLHFHQKRAEPRQAKLFLEEGSTARSQEPGIAAFTRCSKREQAGR